MEILNMVIEFIGMLPEYLGKLSSVLVALIAFFMLIPGEQPEKFLQSVVDFIKKLSIKKK